MIRREYNLDFKLLMSGDASFRRDISENSESWTVLLSLELDIEVKMNSEWWRILKLEFAFIWVAF